MLSSDAVASDDELSFATSPALPPLDVNRYSQSMELQGAGVHPLWADDEPDTCLVDEEASSA